MSSKMVLVSAANFLIHASCNSFFIELVFKLYPGLKLRRVASSSDWRVPLKLDLFDLYWISLDLDGIK